MKLRPENLNLFIFPARMNPVGQQDDDNVLVQVHPYGRSGKTQVPDTG